jgi:hypothetical protein
MMKKPALRWSQSLRQKGGVGRGAVASRSSESSSKVQAAAGECVVALAIHYKGQEKQQQQQGQQ